MAATTQNQPNPVHSANSSRNTITNPTAHPYTCLSCSLAFTTAQAQRSHYSTDLHRYNSKRSVAGLAPVDVSTFNQKVLERRNETSSGLMSDNLARRCEACGKSFASQGAESSHLASKRHRELVLKIEKDKNMKLSSQSTKDSNRKIIEGSVEDGRRPSAQVEESLKMDVDSGSVADKKKEGLDLLVQARLQNAPQLKPTDCLFCPRSKSLNFPDVETTLSHMLKSHGFYLPDQDYLVDRAGLLKYLAETIAAWNVCIYCGSGFGGKIQSSDEPDDQALLAKRGLERVRKHMCDKNHCKITWDTEAQRLEYSDFYDYRSSYDSILNRKTQKPRVKTLKTRLDEDDWEDVSMDEGEVDDDDDEIPDTGFSFGDSLFELVLPNGTRIGHRALRHIYKQNLLPYAIGSQSTQAGNRNINLITRLAVLANNDRSNPSQSQLMVKSDLIRDSSSKASSASLLDSALIPGRGGGLNFNQKAENQTVVRARNRGEAREAGKHIRTFKDAQRREHFKTRVGCTSGNNQKHYRDPLLQ
ncbi:cytoplasm protein, partial [Phakopsora pachyrhizi]